MLTPEYIDGMGEELLGLYDALEDSIIEDIARRIAKTGYLTDTASWQVIQAQYGGMLMDDVIEQVAYATQYSKEEVAQIFQDAGAENIAIESASVKLAGGKTVSLAGSGAMRRLLNENSKIVNNELKTLTRTTALTSQTAYINATNLAYMQVTSGAFSYQEAITRAIKAAAVDGVKIRYPSGRTTNLDVAVRRAVLTGVNQTAGKLTETYAEECGCEYYETSAHFGARPSHAEWQGQVFKINGYDSRYRNFYDVTGYGSGDGLCGWNCRHSFHMFWPGISKPAYSREQIARYNEKTVSYNGVQMTEYEATQEARRLERGIRETKRTLTGYNAAIQAADDESLRKSLQGQFEVESARLKAKEARLKDFCNQTNRKYESARMQVKAYKDESGRIVHFDRSTAQKAVQANNRKLTRDIKESGANITLANYRGYSYNQKQLLTRYISGVKSGKVTSLSTFDNYEKLYQRVGSSIVGTETANGIQITAQSNHFVDRVIGTLCDAKTHKGRNGVEIEAIKDALQNPLEIKPIVKGKKGNSQKFIGRNGTVSINPDTGVLIQCNPTDKKIVERWEKKNGKLHADK